MAFDPAKSSPPSKARAIVQHGPATRLMSPSDLGEILKPFVFLDLFDHEGAPFNGHPDLRRGRQRQGHIAGRRRRMDARRRTRFAMPRRTFRRSGRASFKKARRARAGNQPRAFPRRRRNGVPQASPAGVFMSYFCCGAMIVDAIMSGADCNGSAISCCRTRSCAIAAWTSANATSSAHHTADRASGTEGL
jgi:hypothetical protein